MSELSMFKVASETSRALGAAGSRARRSCMPQVCKPKFAHEVEGGVRRMESRLGESKVLPAHAYVRTENRHIEVYELQEHCETA